MRHLPEEQQGEEQPAHAVDGAELGRRADDRRDRARQRADERAPGGQRLERRVKEQVRERGRRREGARQRVGAEPHEPYAGDQQHHPEEQGRAGADDPRGDRTVARALHLRVRVAFPPHVDRATAAGREGRAEGEGDEHLGVGRLRGRAAEIAGERGQDGEERQPGLGQLPVGGRHGSGAFAHRSCRGGFTRRVKGKSVAPAQAASVRARRCARASAAQSEEKSAAPTTRWTVRTCGLS